MSHDGHADGPPDGRMEIWVDQSECVSAGRCVAAMPGLFAFDDDELATVIGDAPRPDDEALVRVARACPNGAIHLSLNGVEIDI